VINGNNHIKNSKTIKLREMIDRNRKQATHLWGPGHMGIPGNEQADEEAKGRKIEHEYDGDTRGMTRREQVVISRLRTGYTRATHRPRMNGIKDTQCPSCYTGLEVDHVLWDCTETEQTKIEMSDPTKL
jgi:hypothetical protein